MAQQRAIGTFGDYTAPQEGVYNPWAVGINAFMGGTQYAADRKAQEQERAFSEETRRRQRKEWLEDDAVVQKISALSAQRAELAQQIEAQAQPGAQAQPPGALGVGVSPGADAMLQAVAGPRPPAQAIPFAPGQGPAPAQQPQSPGGTTRDPNPLLDPGLLRKQALLDKQMAAVYEQANPLRFGQQQQQMDQRATAAYKQYLDRGRTEGMALLESGDSKALQAWKARYPDLARAAALDDIESMEIVRVPGPYQSPVNKYVFRDAKGMPIGMYTREQVTGRIAKLADDPSQFGTLMTYARNIETEEQKRQESMRGVQQKDRELRLEEGRINQQEFHNAELLRMRGVEVNNATLKAYGDAHATVLKDGPQQVDQYLTGVFTKTGDLAPQGEGSPLAGVTIYTGRGVYGDATSVLAAGKVGKGDIIRASEGIMRSTIDLYGPDKYSPAEAATLGLTAVALQQAVRSGAKSPTLLMADGRRAKLIDSEAGPRLQVVGYRRDPNARNPNAIQETLEMDVPIDYGRFSKWAASQGTKSAIPTK